MVEVSSQEPQGSGDKSKRKPERSSNDKVKPYEVGSFSDLKRRSLSGDGLDIHHVPQKHPASQSIDGYSANEGPSIAVPRAMHQAIPRRSGAYEGTARDLIQGDLNDLRTYTDAPDDAIQQLQDLIEKSYPDAR